MGMRLRCCCWNMERSKEWARGQGETRTTRRHKPAKTCFCEWLLWLLWCAMRLYSVPEIPPEPVAYQWTVSKVREASEQQCHSSPAPSGQASLWVCPGVLGLKIHLFTTCVRKSSAALLPSVLWGRGCHNNNNIIYYFNTDNITATTTITTSTDSAN